MTFTLMYITITTIIYTESILRGGMIHKIKINKHAYILPFTELQNIISVYFVTTEFYAPLTSI